MFQRCCGRRPGRRGFTLIELLVVIAIIAILAAILFPVFAQAREKARQTTCTSNVKQLALGVMMYVQDYDETFPLMFNYGPPLPPEQRFYGLQPTVWTWQNHSMSYVKNYEIHQCPSGWSQRSTWSGAPHRANGGYGGNDHLMPSGGVSGAKLAAVEAPADTFLIMDGGNYTADCCDYQDARHPSNYLPGARWNEKCFNSRYSGGRRACQPKTLAQAQTYWNNYPPTQPIGDVVRDALQGRHNRRITVAFADGHVKTADPDQVLFARDNWFRPARPCCTANPPPY